MTHAIKQTANQNEIELGKFLIEVSTLLSEMTRPTEKDLATSSAVYWARMVEIERQARELMGRV